MGAGDVDWRESTIDRAMKYSRYPRYIQLFNDLERLVDEYLIADYVPSAPILDRNSIIRTQGSCFATNIAEALKQRNLVVHHFPFTENTNSPHANRITYEYVADPTKAYSCAEHERIFTPKILKALRTDVPKANVFILTLGLAASWFRVGASIPCLEVDARHLENYEYRFEDVAANLDHIRTIVAAIRTLNPTIAIVLTLSPVPMNIDTTHGSAIVGDFISKATLRLAIDQFLKEAPANLYYWPAFEIVRCLGTHLAPVFGADDGEARHVNNSLVEFIVRMFLKYYAVPAVGTVSPST
jgi:hypothetical protein